jgi:toxin YoeB
MKISFVNNDVFEDYNEWVLTDKKIAKKIIVLIKDISRSPYSGLGKPEPLKYELSGYSKIWFNTPLNLRFTLAAAGRKHNMGLFGIKTDVLINFLSNEPPFRNSTTLKIPQSLLCGGSLVA